MTIKEKYRSETDQISLSDDYKQNLAQKSIAVSRKHSSGFFTSKRLVTVLSSVCLFALILLSAYFVLSGPAKSSFTEQAFFRGNKNQAPSEDCDSVEESNTPVHSTPVWSISSFEESGENELLPEAPYYELLSGCIPDKLILSQPDENGVYLVYSSDRTSVVAMIVPSDSFSDLYYSEKSGDPIKTESIASLNFIVINNSLDSETFNDMIQKINQSITTE